MSVTNVEKIIENREEIIRIQGRMATFEEQMMVEVNKKFDKLEAALLKLVEENHALKLDFAKHEAVQSSWQRYVAPTLSAVTSGVIVSGLTYLLLM